MDDLLKAFKTIKSGNYNPDHPLCFNLAEELESMGFAWGVAQEIVDTTNRKLAPSWPQFSGDVNYPVPCPSSLEKDPAFIDFLEGRDPNLSLAEHAWDFHFFDGLYPTRGHLAWDHRVAYGRLYLTFIDHCIKELSREHL